jgi:Protein of unknown function (DUF1592)/Protein of unknown function (DUF1588)/Protein of unknown function (DUF1587)/Protein of unknown function (DUF1585)/Protein of unknown function (DUF1595)/Planctomycete cytochrome C
MRIFGYLIQLSGITFATCCVVGFGSTGSLLRATDFRPGVEDFLEKHCYECHDDLTAEAGLDLTSLSTDLVDAATQAKWIHVYDRIAQGEMPPRDQPQPSEGEKRILRERLAPPLNAAHEVGKATVLRRLNRQEYENTLNDLLGIRLNLAAGLPEDGRSHEFDTVGGALGVSMMHLESYLTAATRALDEAVAKHPTAPEPTTITATYAKTQGAEKFLGDSWLLAPDDAVVFFIARSYPTGMLREANTKKRGLYRIRVTGYAYQSERPVTFAVGATSFERGSSRPTFGHAEFQPGAPQTVEMTAWIESNYMIEITPEGLHDPEYQIKKLGIKQYPGPGLAIQSVELHGPITESWPSTGHRLLFDGLDRREIEPGNANDKTKSWYVPKYEIHAGDPSSAVRPVLERFASAAFRRPVGEPDVAPYLLLFQKELHEGASFETALRTSVAAMLCAPDFLYLRENSGVLGEHALATRLSYALSRSAPDASLRAHADAGTLATTNGRLREEAERLLDGPHGERFVNDFTDAWLDLRNITFTNPDEKLFPEFDPYLEFSMVQETRRTFRQMIEKNAPITDVVAADYTILNERLALHYGIAGVRGPAWRQVSLPADSHRGGFLTHASVLKVSANGTNTSPVVRGVWVNERILGKHPAPPPPGIPGVEPDIRGATTLRETLALHRNSESCMGCHSMIDPPGFALESFDPIGGWRDTFRSLGDGPKPEQVFAGNKKISYRLGQPVDASGELPDGRSFTGFEEYRTLLAGDPAALAKNFVTKFLTFATGRELGFSDRPEVNQIVSTAAANGYGMRELVLLSIDSQIFRKK